MKKIFAALIFLSNITFASQVVHNSINGTGCDSSNSSVTTSPDGSVISVLYDNLNVEVPNIPPFIRGVHMGERKTIKHCNISFSVNVKPNEYIESVEVINDVRGLIFLDDGIKTIFKSEVLKKPLSNSPRSSRKEIITYKEWNDFTDEDLFFTQTEIFNLRQTCGKEETLAFKFRNTLSIEMTRTALDDGLSGLIAVDSQDTTGNVKFKINYKKCNTHRSTRRSRTQRNTSNGSSSRMDRVRMICERNGGRLVGTRCIR